MMLIFNVLDRDYQYKQLFFDPYTFKFYKDTEGGLLGLPNQYFTDNQRLYRKTLILPLGYQCGNRCIYCIQHKMQNVELNIKKLKKKIKEQICNGLQRIHFIGGEPLLQFDVIKDIVQTFPDIQYSIITNGLHLNTEITDYLIGHNFIVTISHDGPSHTLQRGKDVLVHDSLQFACIKRLSENLQVDISSVLCDDGDTTKDRYIYFSKLGIKFSNIDIKPIIPYTEGLLKLLNLSDNWYNYFCNLISDLQEISSINNNIHLDVLSNINYLCFNTMTRYDKNTTRCSIFNDHVTTLDQAGNIQYCHNTQLPITEENTILFQRKDRIEKCKNCPIFLLCTGACRLLPDTVWSTACYSTYYHYLAHLIHFVYQTFGYMTISIEGDFLHANTSGKFTIACHHDENR